MPLVAGKVIFFQWFEKGAKVCNLIQTCNLHVNENEQVRLEHVLTFFHIRSLHFAHIRPDIVNKNQTIETFYKINESHIQYI